MCKIYYIKRCLIMLLIDAVRISNYSQLWNPEDIHLGGEKSRSGHFVPTRPCMFIFWEGVSFTFVLKPLACSNRNAFCQWIWNNPAFRFRQLTPRLSPLQLRFFAPVATPRRENATGRHEPYGTLGHRKVLIMSIQC